MINTWMDLLFLIIGTITVALFAYCGWDMFQSWRAGRAKPENRRRERR